MEETKNKEQEVNFTYETLYELLRREKNKEELQELNEEFQKQALEYLKEKQELYDETLKKDDLFSINEREALHTQINNIRKLLKDFYDKRERKIIDMAINAVKINRKVIDTSALLISETTLFEELIDVLEKSRKEILLNMLLLRKPIDVKEKTETKEKEHKQEMVGIVAETLKSELQKLSNKVESQKKAIKKSQNNEEEKESTIKTIKFKEDVEQFVGKNLELYGPFAEGDEAKVPIEIANILLTQEKAEEI